MSLGLFIAGMMSHPIVAIGVLLGLLVFIHEFGHFIVGKAFGIGVETFSIGFGPKLLGFEHKGTQYRLSWLPLGGFVKFAGMLQSEDVPESFRGKEFYNASWLAQACAIAAGPLANFGLAIVVYSFLGMKGIEHPSPIIGQIRHGSPAALAGLKSGDKVIGVNGQKIASWTDLQEAISLAPEQKLDLELVREHKTLHLSVVPQVVMLEDMSGKNQKRGRIGIGYGFLPPYLSLLATPSMARTSGIQDAQEIHKVGVGDKEFLTKTWDDFCEALDYAYQNKAESLWMDVSALNSQTTERKRLRTDPWWTASHPKLTGDDLARLLGIRDSQLTIASTEEPVDHVLKKGDRLLSFEGVELSDIYGLSELLQKNEKAHVHLNVQRGESVMAVDLDLRPVEVQKPAGKATAYLLPVSFLGALVPPPPYVEIYPDLLSALKFASVTTGQQSLEIVRVIGGLFSGAVPLKVLGGPILIAKMAGESAKLGLQSFLTSMALVSINLGVLNLFPIPALDGGKLFMTGIEVVFRRRLNVAFVENFHKIGFVMLLALLVLATYNDLSRFWASMLQDVVGRFK